MIRRCCALLLLLAGTVARADAVEIDARAWIEPPSGIVPTQQVRLMIEVASPLRFARSSRIAPPEVSGLIALQQEQFATNYTENREGRTWNVQRWELVLYAQTAGTFDVPGVGLRSYVVLQEPDGEEEVAVTSNALSFTATYPDALAGYPEEMKAMFVAARQFTVQDNWDCSFECALESLQPGDAVARSIEMRAGNSHTLMLPGVEFDAYQGLSLYPQLTRQDNSLYRGDYRAEKTLGAQFVAEETGTYVFPPLRFLWWDTGSGVLNEIELAGRSLVVGGDPTVKPIIEPAPEKSQEAAVSWWRLLLLLSAALGLWLLLRVALWQWRRGAPARARRKLLASARAETDPLRATALLYRYLDALHAEGYQWQLEPHLARLGDQEGSRARRYLQQVYAAIDAQDPALKRELIAALRRPPPLPAAAPDGAFFLN